MKTVNRVIFDTAIPVQIFDNVAEAAKAPGGSDANVLDTLNTALWNKRSGDAREIAVKALVEASGIALKTKTTKTEKGNTSVKRNETDEAYVDRVTKEKPEAVATWKASLPALFANAKFAIVWPGQGDTAPTKPQIKIAQSFLNGERDLTAFLAKCTKLGLSKFTPPAPGTAATPEQVLALASLVREFSSL